MSLCGSRPDGIMLLLLSSLILSSTQSNPFAAAESLLEIRQIGAGALLPYQNAPDLFARNDPFCAKSDQRSCGRLSRITPSEFCCDEKSSCLNIAANTTVVCCPLGATCNKISPIVCDLSQQNVTSHPDSPIHTIALDGKLPKCGDSCCPWGYKCKGNKECVLSDDQESYSSLIPQSLRPETSTSTIAPTTTSTAEATTTNTSPPSTATTDAATNPVGSLDDPENHKRAESRTGMITGVTVGGICSVAILAVLVWTRCRRKTRPPSSAPPNRDSGWGSWKWSSSNGNNTPLLPYSLQRGPGGKLVLTPKDSEFSPRTATTMSPNEQYGVSGPAELPSPDMQQYQYSNFQAMRPEPPLPDLPHQRQLTQVTRGPIESTVPRGERDQRQRTYVPSEPVGWATSNVSHHQPGMDPGRMYPTSTSEHQQRFYQQQGRYPRRQHRRPPPLQNHQRQSLNYQRQQQNEVTGPVELPATPVSPCMWMNLENAAVEEPKLAYVLPTRRNDGHGR